MGKRNERRRALAGRALGAAIAMALIWMAAGLRAEGQIGTTTVQGTIYRADGTVASGTVLLSWPAFTTPQNQAVAAGTLSATIGADGLLSVSLTPNAGALPAGSYYTAVYHLSDGTVNQEYWVVPASGTASVASVRAQLEPSTVAVQPPVTQAYVTSALASLGSSYLPLSGGTMSGALTLSGDPGAENQAATRHYVDQTAAQLLPLSGGNVHGTVSVQQQINKLPRTDVTHPDFASGCAGVNGNASGLADPTGAADSTCAVEAAINFAESQYTLSGGAIDSALYFPHGVYKISQALRIPCGIPILGDGKTATMIEQTGTYANGITIYSGQMSQPGGGAASTNCAGFLRDLTIEGQGHLTWGTLLEIDPISTGYEIEDVRLYNTAGRGMQDNDSERLKITNLEIDNVRWSGIFTDDVNETQWSGVQIGSPALLADSYCYSVNCGASYQRETTAMTAGLTLVSASGNGHWGTWVFSNANGVSPFSAGQGFYVSGITGTTALNGAFQIANVANSTPAPNEFTLTAPAAANGAGTVGAGVTLEPAWFPDPHAALELEGSNIKIENGSIKSLVYQNAVQNYSAGNDLEISHLYMEGASTSPPAINASLIAGGSTYVMQLSNVTRNASGSYSTAIVPWNQGMWGYAWVNDPQDVANALGRGVCDTVRILPWDAQAGNSSLSAYQPGVAMSQFESACAVFTPLSTTQGVQVTFIPNEAGSTAPANTAWINGSLMAFVPAGGQGEGLKAASNQHYANDGTGFASGWYAACNDTSPNELCSEIINGEIPNGILTPPPGMPSWQIGWPYQQQLLLSGVALGSGGEQYGQWDVKDPSSGTTVVENTYGYNANGAGTFYGQPSGNAPVNGAESNGLLDNLLAVVNYGGAGSPWCYANPNSGEQCETLSANGNVFFDYEDLTTGLHASYLDEATAGSADFAQRLDSWNSAEFGDADAFGLQYGNKYCSYDTPPAGQTHSLARFCLWGGPANSPKMEWDTWGGSAWTPSFFATSNGLGGNNLNAETVTGASINGELTVDGTIYTTLNQAWSVAVALANATGQDQTVRLGPGTYPVTATLTEPGNGSCVSLIGSAGTTMNADSAQIATTLTVPNALGGDVVFLGNAAQAQGCTFRDLNVLAQGHATHGFEMQWFRGLLIDNVAVNDTTAEGILLGEENNASGHEASFLLRNATVSYSPTVFTPANRPAYGVHLQQTAMDSYLEDIVVRNALTAAVYNEGTGNTGYLIHGFGYPYTCATGPCANNAASGTAANASYASNYVIYDTGGGGSTWTDTYIDSPAVSGFYVGANGVSIRGGHIQWPDETSFPAANLAYVAASVTNNLLIADVDCLGMSNGANWITYAGVAGDPPTFASVHHLTGCGNYYQALEPAEVTGFSSGGANVADASGAVPRVWSTPIAAASNYPAYAAQMYPGYQGDVLQAHVSGSSPFFNVTYQGTIRTAGGLALGTVINTASTLTLTAANGNVIANASGGPQTLTLPSCYTPWADKASPAGLELTIVKSDPSSNAVTLQTVSGQLIFNQGASATTLALSTPSAQTLVCGPDNNWYVAESSAATISGNAATATALAATPAPCPAGSYATGIAANGNAICEQAWRMTWYGYFGGTFGTSTNLSLGSVWSPSSAISMTRLDIAVGTAPAGCTTWPTIGVYDSTSAAWLKTVTLASGQYAYRNAVSGVSVPAGHNLSMGVQTAGAGCSTNPQNAQLTMEYTMNQ